MSPLPATVRRSTGTRRRGRVRLSAVALVVSLAGCSDGHPSPTVSVDVTVLDIVEAFEAGTRVRILAEDPDNPLLATPAFFEKDTLLATDETHRLIRARAESAFELTVGPYGPGAVLHARTMVFSHARNDPEQADPAPIRFRILVDGVERVSLRSDYILEQEGHEHPFDQLMRTLSVPLPETEGRPALLRFETTRGDEPAPAADVVVAEPLWWDLVVRQPIAVARQPSSPARPNLLVLCVDTLALGHTSLAGYARDTTPNLSALAARGTVFERASAPSSWTLPSVASMLTGLPPNTHGVLGDARSYLMDGLATWPELLRREGIEGAAFVSNPLVAEANNFAQGFGTWVQDNDVDACALQQHLLGWLDGQPEGRRWFAYVHAMDPHAPYGAPGEARERYTDGYVEARDFGGFLPNQLQRGEIEPFDAAAQDHVVDLYDGEVAWFDECLGALLDALRSRGLLETTTIAIVADHGEELFEHGGLGHGYALSEPMLAVPLVLAGPLVPVGERVSVPVGTASLAATLLGLAGVTPAADLAPSLLPLAAGAEPVFATVRSQLFGPRRVLVSARDAEGRKVVHVLDEDGALQETAHHDLRADPTETAPLVLGSLPADERRAHVALAAAALDWSRRTAEARPAEPQPPVSPEVRDAFDAIGYTGKDGGL